MPEPIVEKAAPIFAATRRVFDAGLARDDSAFTPGLSVWTAVAADDLERRFVQAPQTGPGKFVEKLRRQLGGAPQETAQLAAELLYVYLLPPNDIGVAAKRLLLSEALALCPEPASVPAELDAALDGGFARAGTAYHTQRDRQLAWLVRFVQAWKALPSDRQQVALADPWRFREVADLVSIGSAYSMRNALLHLAFPQTFESIVARRHKTAILDVFSAEIPQRTGDEDRDLLALRRELERRAGTPISFYRSELEQRWRGTTPGPELRGWLVRGANVHGRNLVPAWLADGYCSIAFPELEGAAAGLTRSRLDAILAEQFPELSVRQRGLQVGVLDRFLNQIRPGDVVVTVDGPNVYVGAVTGDAFHLETPDRLSGHRRPVAWANVDAPFTRDQLSGGARDRLAGQLTVSSLGAEVAEFVSLTDLDAGTAVGDGPGARQALLPTELPEAPQPVELPEPTQQLAEELFVDLGWLAETVDLLRDKHQIVLYGPPGTGKTFLAQELARFLTEQTGGEYRLVQFHPSYSYEDFFEGFRPQPGATAGSVAFSLEPGPLKLLVQQAAQDESRACVLVIDEINRANLAKVFGELYFLLEYRNRTVQLQYSPAEDFRLPPNLYLIATMNTADRSIALVDAAMRRRFAWQGLFPGAPPVAGMLRRWLAAQNLPADRADLLDALNARLGNRENAIGPSYLMTQHVGTDAGLERVWKHHILPLLEDRHFGENVDVAARYGLAGLRSGATPPAAEDEPEPAEETGEPL
jgi:5-methylcytosine-specific restriction enzyme B